MWDVLKVYGMGGKLTDGVNAFYRDRNVCVKVKRDMALEYRVV